MRCSPDITMLCCSGPCTAQLAASFKVGNSLLFVQHLPSRTAARDGKWWRTWIIGLMVNSIFCYFLIMLVWMPVAHLYQQISSSNNKSGLFWLQLPFTSFLEIFSGSPSCGLSEVLQGLRWFPAQWKINELAARDIHHPHSSQDRVHEKASITGITKSDKARALLFRNAKKIPKRLPARSIQIGIT